MTTLIGGVRNEDILGRGLESRAAWFIIFNGTFQHYSRFNLMAHSKHKKSLCRFLLHDSFQIQVQVQVQSLA